MISIAGTLPVRLNVPQNSARVTVVIEDSRGQRVRNLAADLDRRGIQQVRPHSGLSRQLRPQLFDDIVHAQLPLCARLQVDHQLAIVRTAQVGRGGTAHAGH